MSSSIKKIKKTKLLLLLFSFLCTIPAMAQNKFLSIDMKDATIENVINKIESVSDYKFLYNKQQVNVDAKISISAKDKTIQDVLTQLFANTDISYSINNKQIVLRKSEISPSNKGGEMRKLSGVVVDENGETVIGANVVVKGGKTGTVTNIDGKFSLEVPDNGVLNVTYIGYAPQEVKYGQKKNVTVVMRESANALEEVIVVGFGKQKKESVIGAIQSLKSSDMRVPSTNLSNTFAGRIAGVISVQKSGEPGADGANFWIRGVSTFAGGQAQSPLILIDGTESSTYDLNALAPEVIESFSVLKDATATALYGSRGANGVMLITTKSGREGKPMINVRVEGRMSMPTQVPKLADGVTYMKMFNEAKLTRNPKDELQFTEEQIRGTIENRNPYLYPNVNWYNTIFKDISYNQAANVNVSGGFKGTDYFVSGSFNNETGLVKETSENPFKNNIQNIRYSFQANVNTHITRTTKMGIKLNVQIQDYKGPRNDMNYIFGRVMWAQPTYFPVKYPQIPGTTYTAWGNKSGGAQNGRYPNPYAELASGIDEMFRITTMATFNLDQDLKFITRGLSLKGLFSMKSFTSTTTGRYSVPYYFEPNPNADHTGFLNGTAPLDLKAVNTDGTDAVTANNVFAGDRLFNITASLDYQRKFAQKHEVSAQFIYLQRGVYKSNPTEDDYNDALGTLNQGIAGRVTYDFDKRYFAEFNFGYNGSDAFVKGKRFGFFPSYAVGYLISNEDFFSPLLDVVNLLKLRGSYGTVGNAYTSTRFPGITNVNMNGGSYGFGENFTNESGAIITGYGNENATWEVSKKTNVGIELGMFDQKVLLIADWFHENRDNILMKRRTISPTIGIGNANPYANIGSVKNQGVDMSLEYNHVFSRDVVLSVKGNFTYAKNEVVAKDEPYYPYDYQYEKGGSLNRMGPAYIADGLFRDEADIKNSPSQASIMENIKPGDIKYKDMNGDHVITPDDRTYIGDPYIPQIVYGFGASFKYKRWDISAFFQGVAKVSIYMDDIHPFDVYHKNVLQFVADDYWSESNPNPQAKYPRLAHNTDNTNTYQKSTFWLRSGAFLRLKNAEIGYSYKFLRAYLSGQNLVTFSGFKYWDPEIGGGSNRGNGLVYPLQRVINLGVQFNF